MISNTKEWIAQHFGIKEETVEAYFTNDDVTGFLIIWTIFEQKTKGEFFKYESIQQFVGLEYQGILSKLETEFSHFHSRYQDDGKLRKLEHTKEGKSGNTEIKKILNSSVDAISKEDKIRLLIYVVFRYRNNIFHGNKGVASWTQFGKEIGYCVNIMKVLLETRNDH